MKKMIKIILIAVLVIILLIIAIIVIAVIQSQKSYAEDQLKMPKSDVEMLGERFKVPRAGLDPVKVNLYILEEMKKTSYGIG